MRPSAFLDAMKRYYLLEVVLAAAVLYLLGAFIHMNADPSAWLVRTRVVLGALLLAWIAFAMFVASVKGGKS